MMRCREAARLLAEGEGLSLSRLAALWLHLAVCPPCRAFRRQVRALGAAARRLFGPEPAGAPALSEKVLRSLP